MNSNTEKLRRTILSVATGLGGLITIILVFNDPISMVRNFNIACTIGWLSLAFLFLFSSIKLRKLEIFAFANLIVQYLSTELLDVLLDDTLLVSFYASITNVIFVLIILVLASFLLFSTKTASRLSALFTTTTAFVISGVLLQLPASTRLENIFSLAEPLCYFTISTFLIRSLSIFRSEAQFAKLEAKQFEKMAFFDELTGIANRRKLVDVLQREIAASQRYAQPLSIIIFDIDHFKSVNDAYGHNVGDKVLQAIARSVANTVRTSDSLGRWGGEEFLCILPNTTADVAFELAEHLRLGIADSLMDNGPNITASFGIAQILQSDNFDSFIKRADQALYSAKEQGRNRCKPNPLRDTSGFIFLEPSEHQQLN